MCLLQNPAAGSHWQLHVAYQTPWYRHPCVNSINGWTLVWTSTRNSMPQALVSQLNIWILWQLWLASGHKWVAPWERKRFKVLLEVQKLRHTRGFKNRKGMSHSGLENVAYLCYYKYATLISSNSKVK
jgi:hypothetical protein